MCDIKLLDSKIIGGIIAKVADEKLYKLAIISFLILNFLEFFEFFSNNAILYA